MAAIPISEWLRHYGQYNSNCQSFQRAKELHRTKKKKSLPRHLCQCAAIVGIKVGKFSPEAGGYGFDYRLAMGIPDYWIKIIKELPDEKWNINKLYNELISHRADEKTISYTESHDKALVGDKTIFFRLTDKEMYYSMNKESVSLVID